MSLLTTFTVCVLIPNILEPWSLVIPKQSNLAGCSDGDQHFLRDVGPLKLITDIGELVV